MKQPTIAELIGRRIREVRMTGPGPRRTLADLSERAHVTVSFLSMIERGQRAPHLETLAAIADALEVPIRALVTFDPEATDVEPVYRPLLEACRRHNLGRRDVDRLVSVVRSMAA